MAAEKIPQTVPMIVIVSLLVEMPEIDVATLAKNAATQIQNFLLVSLSIISPFP
jgi:hypothetical protein